MPYKLEASLGKGDAKKTRTGNSGIFSAIQFRKETFENSKVEP